MTVFNFNICCWMIERAFFLQLSHARARVGPESRVHNANDKPAISLPLRLLVGSELELGIWGPNIVPFIAWVRVKEIMDCDAALGCAHHRPNEH